MVVGSAENENVNASLFGANEKQSYFVRIRFPSPDAREPEADAAHTFYKKPLRVGSFGVRQHA